MTPDKQTVQNITERLSSLFQRTLVLDTQVETMMGNATPDVQSPVLVSISVLQKTPLANKVRYSAKRCIIRIYLPMH